MSRLSEHYNSFKSVTKQASNGTNQPTSKSSRIYNSFRSGSAPSGVETLKTSVFHMAKEQGASSEDDFNSAVAAVLSSGEYDDILDQIKADRPKDQDAVAARKAQNDGISYLADWYEEYASTLPKTSEEPKEKKNVLSQLKEAWDGFQAGKDIQRIDGIPVNNYAWGDSTGDKEREQIRGILKDHGILSTQNREGFAVPAVKDSAGADELYRDLIREGYSDDNIRRVFNDYNLGDSYKDIRSRNDDLFAEEEARANALENNIRNKIKYTRAGENLLAGLDDADEVVADLVKEGYSEEEISTAFAKNNIGHLFKTQKQAEADRRADALTEKLNGTEDLGTFRDAAKSVGYSDFEVDNALRRSGNGSLVSEDDQLKHYVFELLGNSATDEQKELFFQSLSQEDKATYSAQMAFDPNVNTDGWMDQLGRTALSVPFNAAAGVLSGYAGFLDMLADNSVTASLVEDINADAARWQALGNDRGSTGNMLISMGGQVTSELLRMYAVSATGEAFGGFAASKGLNKMLVSGAKAMPFVSSSMGSYYREAVESGADRGEAVAYGVVAGTIEGSLEKLGTDEIFSKVLSTKAFKAVPAIQSILHSKAGQKLAHAAVAALSEGLEEGASYVLTGLAQRAIYNPNWSFDSSEFWENAGMGALVGTFGSILTRYPALTDPNADPLERERAIQELDERLSGLYDEQGKLNVKEFDSAVFEAQVAAMPETKVETRLPEAMLLTQDEYREAQSQVYKATAEINAAKEVYDQANASIDSEVTKAQKQFDKADKAFFAVHEQWKMAADPAVKAKLTERLSLLAKQRSEARAKLARTNASAKSKREQTQREYEAATAKDVAARDLNQRLLDDHAIADGEHRKVAIAGRAMDLLSLEYERLLEQANLLGQRMQTEADGTTLDQLGANYDEIIREIQTLREDIGATAEQQMEAESRNNAAHAAWEEQRVRREELAKNLDNLMNEQSANQAKAQAEAEARKAMEAERERVQLAIAEAEARKANIERNERDLDKIEAIARERGLNVKLTNDLSVGRNGKYEDGVLYINSASEDPYFVTFKHEITHHIENSKYYGRYQKIVLENVEKSFKEMGMQGDVLKQLVEMKKAEYAEEGIALDDEKAKREIVASWTQDNLFEDGNAVEFLAKTEPGLFHTVYNYLQSTISKIGEDDVTKSLIEAERLFGRAVNTAKGGKGGEYVRYFASDAENSSIKQQLIEHLQEVNAMGSVADIRNDGRAKLTKAQQQERISQEFKKFGYKVERQGFGTIDISEKAIDESLKYVNTDAEYAAFFAVPRVLKRGTELPGHADHKGRGFRTYTFAAPVTINGITGDMAVVVKETGSYKYKTHRILMPDGSVFEFVEANTETEPTTRASASQNGSGMTPISSVSAQSVSQAGSPVNPSIRKNGEKDAQTSVGEASFSLSDVRPQQPSYEELIAKPDVEIVTYPASATGKTNKEIRQEIAESDIIKRPYLNEDTGEDIFIPANIGRKLVSNQGWMNHYQLKALPEMIRTAKFVGKTEGRAGDDGNLVGTYMFFGAMRTNENAPVIPFKLTVKEEYRKDLFAKNISQYIEKNKLNGNVNKLYDSRILQLETIEPVTTDGVIKEHDSLRTLPSPPGSAEPVTTDGRLNALNTQTTSPSPPGPTISVKDLFALVKGDAEKYIPKPQDETGQFSLGLSLEELVKKYGLIPEGENPVRKANIPRQIDDATRVSRFIRTVAEAGSVSEEVAQAARAKVAEGLGSYTPISNAEAITDAQRRIAERGLSGALNVWKDKLSDERAPSKNDIALGEQLLTEFSNAGDIATCEELIADLSMQASRAGQVTQAFSLLKRMSPAGALYHVESMAKQINKEHKKQIDAGKMKPVEVPEDLKKQLIQARNGNEVQEIKNDIAIALGQQIPATLGDKINAWRYLAMLGNPRTHVRNTLGNAVMYATRRAKDSVGSVIELKLEKGKRTKSIVVGKEYKDYARRMYKEYAGTMSGNKEGFLDAAERSRKVLPGALDKLSKFNSNKLEASDASWKKHTFVSAFAQAMKARGLTESTITPQQRGEIAAYAINEAMKATFQDASRIAAALNRLEKTGKVSKVLVGGLLPFKKTPINILKRGVEYSPIGLIRGVSDAVRGVKSGKDAAQVIDEIASGVTGTALAAVGMLLSSMGVLRGGGEEDDDVEYYLSDTGKQKYSLNVGGVSYTLDWLSPVAMPLFVGVNLQEIMDSGIDEINYGAMVDAMGSIADPLTEMSLLQGLNDVLSNNQNGVGGAMWNAGSTMMQNYASQFVPTILGQFTRAFVDDTRRSTSGDPNEKWGAGIDRAINKVENKIPGVSNTLEPYVDKWGNEQKETSWMVRILENFVSPGYLNVESDSALDTEITRLYYSTGDRDVIPTRPNRYLTQGGVRYTMTNAEYTQYQKAVGTACREAVDRIIAGWSYRTADDLEKAEMVSEAIKDAEAEVRAEFKEKLMGGD